jgi:hypothetical protein
MSAQIKTYAMIETSGTVQNIVLWDGETEYDVAPLVLVQSDTAQIGDVYDGANFTTPSSP